MQYIIVIDSNSCNISEIQHQQPLTFEVRIKNNKKAHLQHRVIRNN